jgi:hypothetical protein
MLSGALQCGTVWDPFQSRAELQTPLLKAVIVYDTFRSFGRVQNCLCFIQIYT